MVRTLLLILTFYFVGSSTYAQEEKILFSEALSLHFPKYDNSARLAYRYRDYDRAKTLFDSLVNYNLRGTYLDNFQFTGLNSKPFKLHDLKKPVYLITYASWCVTSKGEIPALNELAEKYSDLIDFVVVFWDSKKTTRRTAKTYNKHIKVVYVNELYNRDAFTVSRLKHTFGLPTTFLLDKDKKILDIRRGISHSYHVSLEESIDKNHSSIFDGIVNYLLNNESYSSLREPMAAN